MKTLRNLVKTILIAAALAPALKASGQTGEQLKLVFNITANNKTLQPGGTYTNPFGEAYTVQKFRFYVSQIELQDTTSTQTQLFPDSYFLVDAGDTASQTITIPVKVDHLTGITFLIGVDSTANVSGTQQDALDPANGMFWTWNTGYIMMKLQATSPAAKVPANAFTFDVGGYKPGENSTRKIGFFIRHGKKQPVHNITFAVDVNKLFNGSHQVKIAEHPMCHEPGALAMQLADNYATMFSVEKVSK